MSVFPDLKYLIRSEPLRGKLQVGIPYLDPNLTLEALKNMRGHLFIVYISSSNLSTQSILVRMHENSYRSIFFVSTTPKPSILTIEKDGITIYGSVDTIVEISIRKLIAIG